MTVKQIDDLAKHNISAGEEQFTMLEAGLYYHLRQLYNSYSKHKDIMPTEAWKAEKQRIIKQYENEFIALYDYSRVVNENNGLMQRISQHTEIFKQNDLQRTKLSPLIAEANKRGCEICKRIAKMYDGRE